MMLRWSVFLGTGNNSSPHSISTLMFLYLPLYFGPWKLPGDSTSSCILSYLKTLVIKLSSECGVGACCMAVVVLDGIIRLKNVLGILSLVRNNKNLEAAHDETPFGFSNFSNMFFCLCALLMPFGSLCLGWHFSSFSFTFSFAPNLFLCRWTPSQLHGAVGFCEALGKFRLKGANLPHGHKRWICLITNSVAGLKSMLQPTFKKYWHWDFSHCQTGPQTYKSYDFRLIDSVLGVLMEQDIQDHAEIFSFKCFLYCLE